MKFYSVSSEIEERMHKSYVKVYPRVKLVGLEEGFLKEGFIPLEDIISLTFHSSEGKRGGIVNYGILVLDNTHGFYTEDYCGELKEGLKVELYFAFGEDAYSVLRGKLEVSLDGFMEEQTGGLKKTVSVKLNDKSVLLKSKKCCDEKKLVIKNESVSGSSTSIVESLLSSSGISGFQCALCNIPLKVGTLALEGNVWDYLCEIALLYDAHLEDDMGTLNMVESPYSLEGKTLENENFLLEDGEITHYRRYLDKERYFNSLRVKKLKDEEEEYFYIQNKDEIKKNGLYERYLDGRFLSEEEWQGVSFMNMRLNELLDSWSKLKRGMFIKSWMCLVNARAGSNMKVNLHNKRECYRIKEVIYRYKKGSNFYTDFYLGGV